MPLDGSGNYTLPPNTLAVSGTVVNSTYYNAFVNDLVSVLNSPITLPRGGTGGNSVESAQLSLQVKPGTHVQAYNVNLGYLSGLTAATDRLPYFSSGSAMSLTALTEIGRSVIGAADAAAVRTAIDAPSKTAYDAHVAEALVDGDVGTTAGKLVQLDGSAKLPAVDGSQLTNLPDGGPVRAMSALIVGSSTTSAAWTHTPASTGNKIRAEGSFAYSLVTQSNSTSDKPRVRTYLIRNGSVIASSDVYLEKEAGVGAYPILLEANAGVDTEVNFTVSVTLTRGDNLEWVWGSDLRVTFSEVATS